MSKAFVAIFLVLGLACASIAQINPDDITIVRDKWGVPHIFAPKDEQVAYGLAWASAEDNFHEIQENILPVRGKAAEYSGKSGAILDVFGHLMNLNILVDEAYDTSFSEKFKKVLEGYCEGINAYAASHPKDVLVKKVFPLYPKDVIKAYTFSLAFQTHVHFDLGKIFQGYINRHEANLGIGSNAMAVSSSRTADGKTYISINSHQPLDGPFAWYEAHLCSEEGWNILGANFPGGVSMLVGANENLAWAHTLNWPDMDDVYKLTMHEKDKLKYKYDGKWEELEVRKVKLKVKMFGFLKIPITKTFYWSKYGTTIKAKTGVYSVRFPANMDIRAAEQWYLMNKASSLKEFNEVLEMQAFPGINIVYADREDNIMYLGNALLPYRNPNYDWTQVLPGDTSATLWEPKYHPIKDLPKVLNPACGYVLNTNNTPFNATCPEENLKAENFDKTMGYLNDDNNRSLRYHELIAAYEKLSWEDFKTIKYDISFATPTHNNFILGIERLLSMDPTKYPDLAEEIKMVNAWDRKTDIESEAASIVVLAIKNLVDELIEVGKLPGVTILEEEEVVASIRYAQKHLLKYFKTIHVPLGDLQRHIRGDVSMPIGGGPDILAAVHTTYHEKGRLRATAGDSYIELVRYGKDGIEIETINCYGSSNLPESPHYTDQMEMFVNKQTKTMTLDKETIFEEAVKNYHPK
ncbi:MAG: penicillin acylase family protein [Flavobacteriales bacterium]|nr:penicillin acylase family protein [Flavobacteriales bacterium]